MSVKRSLFPRADLLRQLAMPLAAAASFRAGAAIAVIGQPRMPPITGPYGTVGVRVIRLKSEGGDSCRAKVFYPALDDSQNGQDREAVVNAPYCTDGRETSDGMAGLVGFRQLGLSFLLAHLATAKSGCRLNAAPDSENTLPLLVYSHGYGGNMDIASYFMREIASHGVIVVEHTASRQKQI
jgi:predicted dienelactone hydrolase